MEHRWSQRKSIALEAELFYKGHVARSCKTSNVSFEGMFIETNGSPLPKDANIELAFNLPAGHGNKPHRMQAQVVHVNERGVGVMLRNFNVGTLHALQQSPENLAR